MSRSIFKRLAEPEEAILLVKERLGLSLVERILGQGAISVGITDLEGRLLAESITSPRPLPWYPRSLVDGCAVRSVDVAGAFEDRPVTLRYGGRIKIGEKPARPLEPGECMEIDTGAWVPVGADAVVPIEYVTRPREGEARIERGASPGQGIALPATDVATGDQVAWPGAPGTPELVAALAAIGVKRVKATRRVRAAVFSTGDELVEPGSDPGDAGIFDSNRFQLIAWMKRLGYEVLDLGIARDTIEDVEDMIIKAVGEDADVVVTSGGTSAGLEDVVYRALGRRGEVIVHGLRIKPGKPTILGSVGEDRLFIGLPGNPRSAANVFEKVVTRLLSTLGLPSPAYSPRVVEATTVTALPAEKGRHTIVPVSLAPGSGGFLAFPVAKDSYMIASYPKAEGVTIIPAGAHTPPRPGSKIRVELSREPGDKVIYLTDTRLISPPTRPGVKNLYFPTGTPETVIQLLPPGQVVVTSLTPKVEEVAEATEEARRSIVLATRSGQCRRAAVFLPYSTRTKLPGDPVRVPAPRAETAMVMLEQGYVDCALVPGDYAEGLDGFNLEEVDTERVALARVVEPKP
ncbi:MAG: molybdopterin molybdotransferase MoeA [Desulfurococcales archaeon]|nr:molybdopterin molybdotransferase MoeA [Desulfurococcales archaeon]